MGKADVVEARAVSENVAQDEPGTGRGEVPSGNGGRSGTRQLTRHGDPILEAGERLGGYEILNVLGVGGMAVVYSAIQLSLKRQVALKVPLRRWSTDERFMKRFERESEALAALNHPNIVNIIDRGQCGDLPYFVMECVDGFSLERAINQGRLSYGDYLAIIRQVRDALAYIHSNGVVHLDLKPANILLGRNGRVKVSDFGIAAMAWETVLGAPEGGNSVLGTPRFMAPEQLQRAAVLDARTDIYALGVTYHLMLCGAYPEGGQSQASGTGMGMPRAVDTVLNKAIALPPSLRYATVEQFSDDLLEAMVGSSAFLQIDSFIGQPTFGIDEEFEGAPTGPSDGESVELELVETGGTGAMQVAGEPPVIAVPGAAPVQEEPSPEPRRTPVRLLGAVAVAAVLLGAGAYWWPGNLPSLRATTSAPDRPPALTNAEPSPVPPAASPAPRLPAASWAFLKSLPVPRQSYSFMALSPKGDLALATFNNRSLGSLPEDLPVILVREATGSSPKAYEICAHSFASQRGYSGLAFDGGGALLISGDTGFAESSFLMRYTAEGSPDPAFGQGGRLLPGKRCLGIDVAGGHLYVSMETGEVLILDPVTGTQLGVLPKAGGKGIVRDLAVDAETGRVFGVRTGGMVVWEPKAGGKSSFAAYAFRELLPSDQKAPRALEGICFSRAAGRALLIPDKTAETVECDGQAEPTRLPVAKAPAGSVFVDAVADPNGQMLFVSDVAKMQVRVLGRSGEGAASGDSQPGAVAKQ